MSKEPETCPRFTQIAVATGSGNGAQLFALDTDGRVWRRLVPFRQPEEFGWELLSNFVEDD